MSSTVEPRQVSESEWYAAVRRDDATELKALVEQQVAYAGTRLTERCYLRWNATEEHAMVYMPDAEARAPGHVYSEAGAREARISHSCEWCFDHAFKEEQVFHPDGNDKGTA